MHQISVFVVVCLVAASNAAVLNREIGSTFFDDGEQSTDIELSKRPHLLDPSATSGVEASLGSVVNGLDGMGLNLKAFFTQLQVVLQEFSGSFFEALTPMMKAIPAEVMKEGLIKIMKAVSKVHEKLSVIVIDRNPLHPKLSPLDIIGRELADEFGQSKEIMTLTIWGQRVGGLIGAVDDFLLNIVAQLAKKINEADVQLQQDIKEMEAVPADFVKYLVVQGFGTGPMPMAGHYNGDQNRLT